MAWDPALHRRVKEILAGLPGARDRQMFGGVCFTVQGNMACGIVGDDLIVRLGTAEATRALARPHVRPFDFTGRPLAGWVYVGKAGVAEDAELEAWVRKGVEMALSLPAR
jgi:TfoX/Sxy family transcriptional regulator of competence genes